MFQSDVRLHFHFLKELCGCESGMPVTEDPYSFAQEEQKKARKKTVRRSRKPLKTHIKQSTQASCSWVLLRTLPVVEMIR